MGLIYQLNGRIFLQVSTSVCVKGLRVYKTKETVQPLFLPLWERRGIGFWFLQSPLFFSGDERPGVAHMNEVLISPINHTDSFSFAAATAPTLSQSWLWRAAAASATSATAIYAVRWIPLGEKGDSGIVSFAVAHNMTHSPLLILLLLLRLLLL